MAYDTFIVRDVSAANMNIVSRRIHILQWVVYYIAIPIQALRVGPIRHYGVRRDEPAHDGVVEAGVVVVEVVFFIELLACEAIDGCPLAPIVYISEKGGPPKGR